MSLRLTVDRQRWGEHVATVAAAYGAGLVPVVKGNGYGLGRPQLHDIAAELGATTVCVGSNYELDDVPASMRPWVLTPADRPPSSTTGLSAMLTVGHVDHVAALGGWTGDVAVKLQTSMHRYGASSAELPRLLDAISRHGCTPAVFALHLPLVGTDDDRLAEIGGWLARLPADAEVSVSHLDPSGYRALCDVHPGRRLTIRVGTALWHGRPRGEHFHLGADVEAVTALAAGTPAGYRATPMPVDGHLVAVAVGSANGVAPLDHPDPARRSPFHFERRRMPLLEPPHMHTTLCVVRAGDPVPRVGEWVDVQQPLTAVRADDLVWR